MKTELKDVIHLYMGVECEHKMLKRTHKLSPMFLDGWNIEDYKPILRPLSDMTTKERESYNKIVMEGLKSHDFEVQKHDATATLFLLKQGFDLFGLIESEQAITKK
jgi:hypothetical protein